MPRIVIAAVALLGMTALVGSIVMPSPPAWFQSIAAAAITGMLGYLAPGPSRPPTLVTKP